MCLHAKARGNYHKHQYDRRPLFQADYGFLVDQDAKQAIPILSWTGVTLGMASSCVVPQKGVGDYPFAELRRFVMECGQS